MWKAMTSCVHTKSSTSRSARERKDWIRLRKVNQGRRKVENRQNNTPVWSSSCATPAGPSETYRKLKSRKQVKIACRQLAADVNSSQVNPHFKNTHKHKLNQDAYALEVRTKPQGHSVPYIPRTRFGEGERKVFCITRKKLCGRSSIYQLADTLA